MSVRLKKLAKSIQRLVSQKVVELGGGNLLTITDVDLSPKYQNAKIFYVLFGKSSEKDCSTFLKNNLLLIQKYIAENLSLKYAVKLSFAYDKSFDYAEKIESILHGITIPNENGTASEGSELLVE